MMHGGVSSWRSGRAIERNDLLLLLLIGVSADWCFEHDDDDDDDSIV